MQTRIIMYSKIQETKHKLEENWNRIQLRYPDRRYPAVNRQTIIATLGHLMDIKTMQYNKVGTLSVMPDFEWQIQDTIKSAEQEVKWLSWDFYEIHTQLDGALAQLHHAIIIKKLSHSFEAVPNHSPAQRRCTATTRGHFHIM